MAWASKPSGSSLNVPQDGLLLRDVGVHPSPSMWVAKSRNAAGPFCHMAHPAKGPTCQYKRLMLLLLVYDNGAKSVRLETRRRLEYSRLGSLKSFSYGRNNLRSDPPPSISRRVMHSIRYK